MTSLANMDFQTKVTNTLFAQRERIRMLDNPTAYQYYTKHMREQWANLSEEERDTFILQAKHDSKDIKMKRLKLRKKPRKK